MVSPQTASWIGTWERVVRSTTPSFQDQAWEASRMTTPWSHSSQGQATTMRTSTLLRQPSEERDLPSLALTTNGVISQRFPLVGNSLKKDSSETTLPSTT